ncbi:MAG: glutathione S-transferase family protein [Candidatus Eisenbacteria bacterium]|uniref:Glutathione S-transferase family protein n=1 Tax=Eiseniibacteriota bacterium TaxID=2212470 RepID=A0A538U5H3_UNCEI|nr:MAG: glutathione S-transferase family protein [Candidatus Eisenbacteria bacterium]
MITVYVFGNAPVPVRNITRDLRALWALEESGLPYRLQPLDFARGELKRPAYARLNPFGQIPSIDDDGFTLFESAAIVLYVAEKAGKLLPETHEGRTRATQWAFAAVNTVEPPIAELFAIDNFFTDQPWARQRRPAVVEQVKKRLATLEAELAQRPYVIGHEFGAPDILMATVLRLVQQPDLLDAVPNVGAYLARCESRPAWRKVLAEHQQRLAA